MAWHARRFSEASRCFANGVWPTPTIAVRSLSIGVLYDLMGRQVSATIPQLVRHAEQRFADREAVVDPPVRMTFAELGAAVARAARATTASGIRPADRVAIWAPNVHEWIVAALGAVSAGAALVPINTRFKGDEAAYILEKSGAKLLFTVTGFLDTDYVGMLRSAGASIETVVLRDDAPPGTVRWEEFIDRAS